MEQQQQQKAEDQQNTSDSLSYINEQEENGLLPEEEEELFDDANELIGIDELNGEGEEDEEKHVKDKEFFESFPPGYRFCPWDSELIVYYLQKKIGKQELPRNQIRHVNLYKYSPDQITERYPPVGDKEWYFFTPRERKYRNGTRPNRAAGSGYWKATGADREVKHKGSIVGFRKALVFYRGRPPNGTKTDWIMHELRVNEPPRQKTSLDDMRLDDFVLCKIHKKTDKPLIKSQPQPHSAARAFVDKRSSPTPVGNEKFDQNRDTEMVEQNKNDVVGVDMGLNSSAGVSPFQSHGGGGYPLLMDANNPLSYFCPTENSFVSVSTDILSAEIQESMWSTKSYDGFNSINSEFNFLSGIEASLLSTAYSQPVYSKTNNSFDSPPFPKRN